MFEDYDIIVPCDENNVLSVEISKVGLYHIGIVLVEMIMFIHLKMLELVLL